MGAPAQELERRCHPRLQRQIACVLHIEGVWHRGVVREVSARSLRVQTLAALPLGATATVVFLTPDGERVVLEAAVPTRRPLSLSLSRDLSGGVELHTPTPPPVYLRWIRRSLGLPGRGGS